MILGQMNFFNGSRLLGHVKYVRLSKRGVRYALDWANRSDFYSCWTTAVLWAKGEKIAIFHRETYGVETQKFYYNGKI